MTGRGQNSAPGNEEAESQEPVGVNSEAIREVVRAEAFYSHTGPLPDPATLGAYGEIVPGLPEKIVNRMEGENDHRHKLETRGQIIGALLAGGGLIGGVATISLGHDWAGVAIVGSGVAPLVYAFVRNR